MDPARLPSHHPRVRVRVRVRARLRVSRHNLTNLLPLSLNGPLSSSILVEPTGRENLLASLQSLSLDAHRSPQFAMEFVPAPAVHRVLCADCGTPIVPNSANLCVACLRNTVDITEGIPKQGTSSLYLFNATPNPSFPAQHHCKCCA